jgi:hypothetical protein
MDSSWGSSSSSSMNFALGPRNYHDTIYKIEKNTKQWGSVPSNRLFLSFSDTVFFPFAGKMKIQLTRTNLYHYICIYPELLTTLGLKKKLLATLILWIRSKLDGLTSDKIIGSNNLKLRKLSRWGITNRSVILAGLLWPLVEFVLRYKKNLLVGTTQKHMANAWSHLTTTLLWRGTGVG